MEVGIVMRTPYSSASLRGLPMMMMLIVVAMMAAVKGEVFQLLTVRKNEKGQILYGGGFCNGSFSLMVLSLLQELSHELMRKILAIEDN